MRKIITLLFCNLLLGRPYHCGVAMKKLNLLLSLALLFGAKAFAQDGKENKPSDLPRAPQQWAYTYEYDEDSDSVVKQYMEAHEFPDGRILVRGISTKRNDCGQVFALRNAYDAHILALDSDGTELCQATYHKDGYTSRNPYVLKNRQGEAFLLNAFNPDHDTCSLNYYRNFSPPIDHSILGLYKLNDDLSIAESYEWNIPIDTVEYDTLNAPCCGHIAPFSAIVDSEGYLVGAYTKAGSKVPHPAAKDSTIFFKMDFEGNVLKRAGYESTYSGSDLRAFYRFYHLVEADSGYIHYGLEGTVVNQEDRNVVYFDRDFNVVRTRRYLQAAGLPNIQGERWYFGDVNVVRSPHGTTYMTCEADEAEVGVGNYYVSVLYEFDDNSDSPAVVPIKRYAERKTKHFDMATLSKGVAIANDHSLFYVYSLNVGPTGNRDSWIMIDHLTPEFEVMDEVYYDLPGDLMHSEACSITATEDGGVLVELYGYDMTRPEIHYESVVKFPAEAFLGIDEAHANGLSLAIAYPNPGGNEMHIRTAVENAAVEVYDMNGRLVAQQPVTETETVLDATDWAAGTYVWKVISAGKDVESGKWVKE